MNHKKELFKRNDKKLSLFKNLSKSLSKFNAITITLRRAKFLKKTFNNKKKKKYTKNLFIKLISNEYGFKMIKSVKIKKISIIKREKKIGDYSSSATIQLI